MSKALLNQTKALVEALENDTDLAAEVTNAALGDEGGQDAGSQLPPPPEDELSELPPEPGMEGPGGGPEDEALGLLRDIASGIGRLADEIAPVEELGGEFGAPGEGGEGAEGGEGGEGAEGGAPPFGGAEGGNNEGEEGGKKKKKTDEPGVPPADDDDDDDKFGETMPVSSGA